MQFRVVRVVNL